MGLSGAAGGALRGPHPSAGGLGAVDDPAAARGRAHGPDALPRRLAFLDDWPGLPIADDEGEIIAGALGSKRSILLAHHGLLTAGSGVEEAVCLAVLFEQAAQRQLMAAAAGTIVPVDPVLAREWHDFLLQPSIVGARFAMYARRMLRSDGDFLSA